MSYTEDDTFRRLKKVSYDELIAKIGDLAGFPVIEKWTDEECKFVERFGWTEIEAKEFELEYRLDKNSVLLAHIVELKRAKFLVEHSLT